MLVKPIVRSIVRPIAGNPMRANGSGFSPVSLFADGSKGVVYDNNDLSSFYLDSAGTTPATVNGLVGLQLDKSQGLALGAEIVVDGGFDAGTGWTAGTGWVIGSGVASAAGLTADSLRTSIAGYDTGKWYLVSFDKTGSASVTVYIRASTAIATTASGRVSLYVLAGAGATRGLEFYLGGAGTIDNVSVKELPGNHRYQTTTGSKPVLRGTPTGANLVTNGDFASGTGWTAGSGWAIGSGVATATASSGTLTSTLTATIAKVYRLTYTITASAGSVQPSFGGVTGASRTAAGTYVEYLTASSAAALVFTGTTFSGTVDNIEVMDVSAGQVTAPYGLQYDGVDDFMQTAAVDFTATDKMFVCAGVRKLSDAVAGMVAELGSSTDTTNGSFNLQLPTTAVIRGRWESRGTVKSITNAPAEFVAPATGVFTGSAKISTDYAELRKDGVSVSTSATDQGTGNYGNYALYFGRRGGASVPYNGLDFGFVIVGKTLTSNQISSTERYIAQRTGVTI